MGMFVGWANWTIWIRRCVERSLRSAIDAPEAVAATVVCGLLVVPANLPDAPHDGNMTPCLHSSVAPCDGMPRFTVYRLQLINRPQRSNNATQRPTVCEQALEHPEELSREGPTGNTASPTLDRRDLVRQKLLSTGFRWRASVICRAYLRFAMIDSAARQSPSTVGKP